MALEQASGQAQGDRRPAVSVIIPARNEEASLGECLASLINQHGIEHEIIVVNDASTDNTRHIAQSFATVTLIDADTLPDGWSGKSNACWSGAKIAKGRWLLFTDADTIHRNASLRHAVKEAEYHNCDLLSYSPKQELHGLLQRMLMPLIFAELRKQYPPKKVNDQRSYIAAANGQYLLIRREAYQLLGGHAAIAHTLLEDVELAKAAKKSGMKIRFRYGRDSVRTHMYRTFGQMWEGWTKNLALLFQNPGKLAFKRTMEFVSPLLILLAMAVAYKFGEWEVAVAGGVVALAVMTNFYVRLIRAHFGFWSLLLAPLGLPLFALLLLRSRRLHRAGQQLTWKGRTYPAEMRGPEPPKAEGVASTT